MRKNFAVYPKSWGLKSTDKNIDHRRVPNLMKFFSRFGKELPMSYNIQDYKPGDVVCWNLGGAITHIGLVANRKSPDGSRFMIVHNIGAGPGYSQIVFSVIRSSDITVMAAEFRFISNLYQLKYGQTKLVLYIRVYK